MIYAQIKDSIIENVIIIDDESLLSLFSEGYDDLVQIDDVNPRPGPGWSYDGEDFAPPVVEESSEIADVTPRQIRQALVLMGISLTDIDNALNALPEPTKSLARIEWEYSISFQRHRPLVESVGAMMGWNSTQLDNLWRFAAGL